MFLILLDVTAGNMFSFFFLSLYQDQMFILLNKIYKKKFKVKTKKQMTWSACVLICDQQVAVSLTSAG